MSDRMMGGDWPYCETAEAAARREYRRQVVRATLAAVSVAVGIWGYVAGLGAIALATGGAALI
ncbi:hypothetical protein ACSHWG_00820 [Leucobacter sp. Z1108]|uniref:hypothetical protein n=1 Tax=Leucobacter sp. Z1108 TaxID=3439066 RepID=UPI003F3A52AB